MAFRDLRARLGAARIVLEDHVGRPTHGPVSRTQRAAFLSVLSRVTGLGPLERESLVSMALEANWDSKDTELVVEAIAPSTSCVPKQRSKQQEAAFLVQFFTEWEWVNILLAVDVDALTKMTLILTRATDLGIRIPTEPTFKLWTAFFLVLTETPEALMKMAAHQKHAVKTSLTTSFRRMVRSHLDPSLFKEVVLPPVEEYRLRFPALFASVFPDQGPVPSKVHAYKLAHVDASFKCRKDGESQIAPSCPTLSLQSPNMAGIGAFANCLVDGLRGLQESQHQMVSMFMGNPVGGSHALGRPALTKSRSLLALAQSSDLQPMQFNRQPLALANASGTQMQYEFSRPPCVQVAALQRLPSSGSDSQRRDDSQSNDSQRRDSLQEAVPLGDVADSEPNTSPVALEPKASSVVAVPIAAPLPGTNAKASFEERSIAMLGMLEKRDKEKKEAAAKAKAEAKAEAKAVATLTAKAAPAAAEAAPAAAEAAPAAPSAVAKAAPKVKATSKSKAKATPTPKEKAKATPTPKPITPCKRKADAEEPPSTEKVRFQMPHFGHEQSRSQFMCRTGFRGKGETETLKYGPGQKYANEAVARATAKEWVHHQFVVQGLLGEDVD